MPTLRDLTRAAQIAMLNPAVSHQTAPLGLRADGTPKGEGFLGAQPRTDGGVSSEISVGVNLDGREVEIPTMVPTLTDPERQWLLSNDISDPHKIPPSIMDKAVSHARGRLAKGLSPFAEPGYPSGSFGDLISLSRKR